MMDKEIAFPHAKINIGLQVTDRLPNGYHRLESLFYPVDWCDALEVVPQGPKGTCRLVTTGIPVGGDASQNLVVKAYNALLDLYPDLPGVEAHLEKRIPFGAGLGGGSSDGAQMLLMLRRMFQLPMSQAEVEAVASKLGADCAFFCRDGAQYLEGIGPELSPYPCTLRGMHIVLVKPSVSVSTREAYSLVTPRHPERPLSELLQVPIALWRGTIVNDFEQSVFAIHPSLANIKRQLYKAGAVYASMSGSGSALFGLFDNEPGDLRNLLPDDCEVHSCDALL